MSATEDGVTALMAEYLKNKILEKHYDGRSEEDKRELRREAFEMSKT